MTDSKSSPSLTLYRGFHFRGRYTPSPFVNKLEARLRIGGLSYRVETGSIFKSPRGKLPYLDFEKVDGDGNPTGSGPEQLTDSTLIARRLIEEGCLPDLNGALTPTERARDLALRALLEDKLYFFQVRERWIDNYYTMRDSVLGFMPLPVRAVVGLLAYRNAKNMLHGQGVLRYSDDEAQALRVEVWENVSALLLESRNKARDAGKAEDEPFWALGGSAPTEADATVFGFIVASLSCKQAPATKEIIRSFPVLEDYAKRIHDQYFSDYERWPDQV
ncbi:hypothetical protein VTH82DRAFT_5456 [Thermothelomyces myriococcoides]